MKKLNKSNQQFLMETALLEIASTNDIRTEDLIIKYNEDTKEWRIIDKVTKLIKFKKIF